MEKKLEDYVLTIPDFPEPGTMFRDITSVLQSSEGLNLAIKELEKVVKNLDCDLVAGTESRGFIFGMPIAYNLRKPFIPVRKKGKLPRETLAIDYNLEYGKATLEIHKDAILKGQRVVLIDDLIATGGTLAAAIKLIEKLGGLVVAVVVLMELESMHGRRALKNYPLYSILKY
jgi:adenine phosphoribosyltransferase